MRSTRTVSTVLRSHSTGNLSTTMFWGLGFGTEKTSEGVSLWHWGDYDTFKAYFYWSADLGTDIGGEQHAF